MKASGSPQPIPGRCNARTRGGGYCQNPPVTGKTRCRMHGGAVGSGRPPIHGLYSKSLRASLADKYTAFLGTDYKDLSNELAIARALLSEYLGRFSDGVRLKGEDIQDLSMLIDRIGKLSERMSRIESRSALTAREIKLLELIIARELTGLLGEEKAAAFVEHIESVLSGEGLLTAPAQIIEGQLTGQNDSQET